MSDITIKTYTTPCKSRSGNYSDGTTVVQSSGSVSYIGSGGSSVDIVKELGTDTLSDANVFSSLRTIKEITDRGHTHSNKAVLDNLTQAVIDNSHTHANKATLDVIDQSLSTASSVQFAKVTANDAELGTIKATTGDFSGALKAAAATVIGLVTCATLNADAATIPTINSTNINASTQVVSPLFVGRLQGNADTATRLKDTFKLWGQDFYGNNVSGAISGATTIDASGAVTLGSTLSVASDATFGGNLGTSTYISQSQGWRVTNAGNADFRSIYTDELHATAFTADVSQALAGSDYLTKSVSKLSVNFVIPSVGSSVRIIVDDLEGYPATQCFENSDYIRFRAFNRTSGLTISDVWGTVQLDTTFGTNGFSNGTQAYTFTCTSTACAGLTVYKGSEVLDYGTSGSGLIVRTTLDSAGSPYSQISTWQTDPSNSANYSVHVRLGNLAGLTNCSGYGLYTDNAFLTKQLLVGDLTKTNNYLSYDATNGLVIKGNLYAASGAQVATSTDVTNLNAAIAVNSASISSLVSKTDATNNVVATHTTAISQLPDTIDARITTQVSANGSIYNAVASSLTMTTEGISLFGKTIQLAGATTFVSSLNSTAHGYATTAKTEAISASLSNTTTAINNLSLSGRNLISQNFSTTQSIEEMGEEVWAIVTHNYGDGYKYAKSTRIQFSLSQGMSYIIHINLLSSMIEGKTYTFSFWYKCLGTTFFSLETGFISETSASTTWKFYSGNITMNSGESRSYIEAFQGINDQADILISDVTFYEGTKYMGFNLSPEDVNDAMAKNLGYTDYSALNTAATAGTTIITGGKINTDLIEAHSIAVEKLIAGSITSDYLDASSIKADIINVSYINTLGITSLGSVTAGSFNLGNGQFIVDNGGNLIANNAVISGNITATSGSIGGFSVSSNQLIATSGANTMLLSASLIRFQSTYDAVYLGSNTISSIAANSLVPMRVEVSRSGSSSDMYMNIGTYYYVDGATSLDSSPEYGNHAIYIGKGNICGFRRTGRRVTSNITASVMDSVFMVFNAVTITLPSSTAEDMQEYFIIDAGGVNITLNAGSGYNVTFKNTSNGGQTWDFSGFKTAIVVFDKTNSIWRGCITAGQ